MRFYCTLKLNGQLVGKGYGSNKRSVKNIASRLTLENLAPTLFGQWKSQRGVGAKGYDPSSGSDSEQSKKGKTLSDLLEDIIGDTPSTGQSEGLCITSEEEIPLESKKL